MEERLVEEREVGRADRGAAAGHAERAHVGMVEAEQCLGGHLGDRQLADAEHGLDLVGSRELADGHELGDAVLLVLREAEDAGQPERTGDAALELVAEVAAGDPVDDLAEDPVGGRRVVLVARPRLPVETPLGEPLHATFARPPLRRAERRVGEAGGVQHHLLDGDHVLAVRAELGDVVDDELGRIDLSLADQCPHR